MSSFLAFLLLMITSFGFRKFTGLQTTTKQQIDSLKKEDYSDLSIHRNSDSREIS